MPVRKRLKITRSDPGGHKGTMETWDGGDVPGIAGERASFERLKVVDEMGDGHFHELVRKRG